MFKGIKDRVVFRGKFIEVIERSFTTKSGKEATWEMAKYKMKGRIVSIFAVTDQNEVVLEKHARVRLQGYVIELPGGMMDKEGESEEGAVLRELREETGYEVLHVEPILLHPLNQRVFGDTVRVFFGSGARKAQEQELDDEEEIEVILVPILGLVEFLEQLPAETAIDQKILACLPLLRRRGLIPDYLHNADSRNRGGLHDSTF